MLNKKNIILPLFTLFVIAVWIGCASNKPIPQNDIAGLTAENVPEGILLTFNHIPPETELVILRFTDSENPVYQYMHTSLMEAELDQLKDTHILICPFLRKGQNYEIIAEFRKFDEADPFYEARAGITVNNDGIYMTNGIMLTLNKAKTKVTLSAAPEFSADVQYWWDRIGKNEVTITHHYAAFILAEDGSLLAVHANESGYANRLTWDISTLADEIKSIPEEEWKAEDYQKLTGNLRAFAGVFCNLEYENLSWIPWLATSEEFILSF